MLHATCDMQRATSYFLQVITSLTCFLRIPLLELFDTTGAIHQFLLAGEERVAIRADLDPDILLGGTRMNHVPADAGDRGFLIFRMYGVFHFFLRFLCVINSLL